jgi:hypothetical protein
VSLKEGVCAQKGKLSNSHNEFLKKPITGEELKKTVFGIKEKSASWPDGFRVTFYKNCWETIVDITNVID